MVERTAKVDFFLTYYTATNNSRNNWLILSAMSLEILLLCTLLFSRKLDLVVIKSYNSLKFWQNFEPNF
jgi:hypothetical protein